MKEGWEIEKLGEVCKVIAGQSPEGKYYNKDGNGLPFYQGKKEYGIKFIGEPTTWTTKITKEAEVGDILMSVRAPVGPVNFATQKICIGRGLAAIRAGKLVNKEYLYNFLVHHENEIEGNAGAVFNSINKTQIENIGFPLPPLPEQQHIVSILDKCFSAIERSRNNAEQNLKNAKELFESYLQGVFEKKGDGWEEVPLGKLCKLTRGHNPPKSKFINEPKDGYVRFYQIRDGWSDNYVVYVPDTPQLHKVNPADMLMVAYRHIGKVFRGVSGAFNVALCKIANSRRDLLDDDFLFYMIPTDIIKGELMKRSERSLIPSMSVAHLKEIVIPLPALKVQKTIVHQLDALRTETQKMEAIYQKKIADLEELKKSVLQKAFAGELPSGEPAEPKTEKELV
jgi:type I restriction enzyme S subunit